MERWNLHEYADRFTGPTIVQTFEVEDDEYTPVLEAAERLKIKKPRSLPLVTLQHSKSEILHLVRRSGKDDAVFDSIYVAHCWIEFRVTMARVRYFTGIGEEPEVHFDIEDVHQPGFEQWARGTPQIKSCWEWLKKPAL